MKLVRQLKDWWKVQTGRDDTPLDGETPYWLLSLAFHVILLLLLATLFVEYQKREQMAVTLNPTVPEIEEMPTLVDIEYEDDEEIGSNDSDNFEAMMDMAPAAEDLTEVEATVEQEIRELGDFVINEHMPEIHSEVDVTSIAVNGVAGQATTGTEGAVDRITHEILLSLEERKTLVVWMFDQSASLLKQRAEILRRFDNVYDELDRLQQAGNEAFEDHDDIPLLTQVVAFGSQYGPMLNQPTEDMDAIKQAIRDIQVDESGIENVFGAVADTGREYRHLCKVDRRTGEKERNVMIVIVSDECGDDIQNLDAAIDICRRNLIRVYTIGVPAPFGRENTFVKWVDPDPEYDQSVQWAPVRQGPESLVPERIKLHFTTNEEEEELFDSGFGPFGLTRLCYQSGGMYFTVHPNRVEQGGQVPRWQTSTYSAHLSRFFDPDIMRRYRPDYVTQQEYLRRLQQNEARMALVNAARLSRVKPMQRPRLRFEKLDEARFVNEVTVAQQSAAVLAPQIDALYQELKKGERHREDEVSLRWQAGYDLAMGRVLAVKIRAESYNNMLAMAKTSLSFENPRNNTWVLRPANEISTGSQAEKLAERARMYLERVIAEHPNTPWAFLAEQELRTPIGWRWTETYTRPPEERAQRQRNNNNTRRNRQQQQREAPAPPPRRPPPKL